MGKIYIKQLKYPTMIIGSVVLLLSLSLSTGIEAISSNLNTKIKKDQIPKTIKFKNRNIRFFLNHFQSVAPFRSKSIVSMKIQYSKGSFQTTATVIVSNKNYQQLIYHVSTDTNKNWNGLVPFKNGAFYKLYEFYPKLWYTTQQPNKKNVHVLKSISYYGGEGKPLSIKDSTYLVFKTVYLITKTDPLEIRLMQIDKAPTSKKEAIGAKKVLVTRIHHNSLGKVVHKEPISTFTFWNIHRQQYYLKRNY